MRRHWHCLLYNVSCCSQGTPLAKPSALPPLLTTHRLYSGQVALGIAVDYALALGLGNIQKRVLVLAAHLRAGLAQIAGITLRDKGRRLCGIVSFTQAGRSAESLCMHHLLTVSGFTRSGRCTTSQCHTSSRMSLFDLHLQDGVEASQVKQALRAQHINVNVSLVGSTRLDFEQRGLTEVVRASVHYYNTVAEVERLLEALRTI